MNIEDRLESIDTSLKTLVTILQSAGTITAVAGAPEAAAAAPTAETKKPRTKKTDEPATKADLVDGDPEGTRYWVSSGLGIWGGKYRIGTRSEYIVAEIQSK